MRIAVVGAGVVGITTAHALHSDGHEVTVYERNGTVASETSFANAGLIAPGYVTPWAAPGMLRKVLSQLLQRDAAVRMATLPGLELAGWLWRWQRACGPVGYLQRRAAMISLAHDSLSRTRALTKDMEIDYENGRGMLVLLRGEKELAQARTGLKLLTDAKIDFHLVDAEKCRQIEPGLNDSMALRAGIHLPDTEVGNCRQFAMQLKHMLQERGVAFQLHHAVHRLSPGSKLELHATVHAETPGSGRDPEPEVHESFDAAIVCAANGAPDLLRSTRMRLPLQSVYGYSVTLPLRQFEAHPDVGPRAAIMDERFKVAIARLGDRVRVAGSAELGGDPLRIREAAVKTLYRVLDDWFPGAASHGQPQVWKGARPMLPDGPPAIGATGLPGLWLNTGHGSSGWALACGSARLVADLVAGRKPMLDPQPFSPTRWNR
ncbi:MAG: FAD-dependent oxidoreductase [Aquincola sp.]|nr:FAD-dependent oxidoreductase [Aquincola sp.]MDH4288229.1 FAD-dependent oxidoreductase [Aquincola sp.]MDH5329518.1 FAD-dependent oxidoreductase [Aquincola sp.]